MAKLPLPQSDRAKVYRKVVALLQTDPILKRTIRPASWYVWDDRPDQKAGVFASAIRHVLVNRGTLTTSWKSAGGTRGCPVASACADTLNASFPWSAGASSCAPFQAQFYPSYAEGATPSSATGPTRASRSPLEEERAAALEVLIARTKHTRDRDLRP